MTDDYLQTVRYITTDFVIKSNQDLSPLADEWEHDMFAHRSEWENDVYHLVLSGPGDFVGPEEAIKHFCDLVLQLGSELLQLFKQKLSCTADIGYNSGISPHCLHNELSFELMQKLTELNINIAITIYRLNDD